jgi:hypothetical protein
MFNKKQSQATHSSELGNKEVLCSTLSSRLCGQIAVISVPVPRTVHHWLQADTFFTFIMIAAHASRTLALFARIPLCHPGREVVCVSWRGLSLFTLVVGQQKKTQCIKMSQGHQPLCLASLGFAVDLVPIKVLPASSSLAAARLLRDLGVALVACLGVIACSRNKEMSTPSFPIQLRSLK